jgi:hypothetical protein
MVVSTVPVAHGAIIIVQPETVIHCPSQNLVHAKSNIPNLATREAELLAADYAPKRRSEDHCWALSGGRQIQRPVDALGA